MLNFEEFQDYIKRALKDHLPEELSDAEIIVKAVTKNNGLVRHGITVLPEGSVIAPNVYLEGFYKDYENGAKLDDVVGKVANTLVAYREVPVDFSNIAQDFMNFDNIKDRIIMVAVNTERNRDLLNEIPHQSREDLSLIYKVAVGRSEDGMSTIAINNRHMEAWGVTTKEIHELAVENTKRILPVKVQSMNEIMMEMLGKDGIPEDMKELMRVEMPVVEQMFVISNDSKVNGAASMFYVDALSELSEKMGTDLYILPSSVHEVIAISSDMGNPEDLADMVKNINGGQVSGEDQLSDHVYYFDSKSKIISLADTTIEEIQEKVSENTGSYEAAQTSVEDNRPHRRR